MTAIRHWPRCAHMNPWLRPYVMENGDGTRYEYEQGACAQCGRPLLRLPPGEMPAADVRFLRQHAAWSYLGKEWEHAGNTVVLR
jgi:hypothetical protein